LVESFYYYGLVLPLAAASRLLSPNRMDQKSAVRPHGTVTNAILYAASAAERPMMRLNKLGGLTVCGICKPG
jgi:hypothetical protein